MHIIKHSSGDVFAGMVLMGRQNVMPRWNSPTESEFEVKVFALPKQAEDAIVDIHLLTEIAVSDFRVVLLSSLSS